MKKLMSIALFVAIVLFAASFAFAQDDFVQAQQTQLQARVIKALAEQFKGDSQVVPNPFGISDYATFRFFLPPDEIKPREEGEVWYYNLDRLRGVFRRASGTHMVPSYLVWYKTSNGVRLKMDGLVISTVWIGDIQAKLRRLAKT